MGLCVSQLMALRFWTYHLQKFHYFMLDFCYFCNVLLLFYIFYYPNSALLFQLIFCLWYVALQCIGAASGKHTNTRAPCL
jgi:hypothetical protein